MHFQSFFEPVERQMRMVEDDLYLALDSEIPLMKEASRHLVEAGGKRLRPAFVLMAGGLFSQDLDILVPMAVAMELVHLASLVHDDVIDKSAYRRGRETVKARYGNEISIYSGDYIFARALMKVAEYNRADVMAIAARASVRVCEGEMVQLITSFDVNQGLKDYLRRIERKTALLMALSCKMGALLTSAPEEMVRAVERYGYYIGMSFQITDDILDFTADEAILGKPTGSDIRQGIITLPALFALGNSPFKRELRILLGSPHQVEKHGDRAIEIIRESGGIEFASRIAEKYVRRAQKMLQVLPPSDFRNAFSSVAEYVYGREF